MAVNASAKQAHALISVYENCYLRKKGKKPIINRHRERWGFTDMIDSVGYERSVELIEYYFQTTPSQPHNVQWLLYNFDKLDKAMTERDEDRKRRKLIMQETQKRMQALNEQ